MHTEHECYYPKEGYPLNHIGPVESLLFFDIETTGFSPLSSMVYLIGCTWKKDDHWEVIQWFADCPSAEIEVLESFFQMLSGIRTLVHFNGDTFDIPFLEKRCEVLGISCPLSNYESFDIYKKVKPVKKLLSVENLKLKTLERFLGIYREDRYSGGELIEVYHQYLFSKNENLLRLLMLHNKEDLEGMPGILPILSYPDFLSADFTYLDHQILYQTNLFGEKEPYLLLSGECPISIPIPIEWENTISFIQAEKNKIVLRTDLYQGTMRHYYPNYKDYYYLPLENKVIHKSIGEFVEKEARTKATKDNCFVSHSGLFFHQPACLFHPDFCHIPEDNCDAAAKRNLRKTIYAEYLPERFLPGKEMDQLVTLLFQSK